MSKTQPTKKDNPIQYGIIEIKLVSREWQRVDFETKDGERYQYQIEVTIEEDDQNLKIGIVIEYTFYENQEQIYSLKTITVYYLPNESYKSLSTHNANFKKQFFIDLTSMAIHHSRGLQNIDGELAKTGAVYIPVLNRSQIEKLVENIKLA